jgi:hypothetical protein
LAFFCLAANAGLEMPEICYTFDLALPDWHQGLDLILDQ